VVGTGVGARVGVGAVVGGGVEAGVAVGLIGLRDSTTATADVGDGLPVTAATLPGAIEAVGMLSPPRTSRKPTEAADAATSRRADAITAVEGPRWPAARTTGAVATSSPRRYRGQLPWPEVRQTSSC
jgi:hypothetical protein